MLTEEDRRGLAEARALLENPGLAVRLSSLLGTPVEKGLDLLPTGLRGSVQEITRAGLLRAAEAAIFTLEDAPGRASRELWHRFGATVSGGVGGMFGASALLAELPVSTTIMLRAIADIARSEGESVQAPETKMACLEVFAFGGSAADDDAADAGYYAVRSLLAGQLSDAAEYVARYGVTEAAGPAVVQFIARIARYFGVQVSQKLAAQALPAIGALGGGAVNAIFIGHYQDMARGHFIVRRLERRYGEELVRDAYRGGASPVLSR